MILSSSAMIGLIFSATAIAQNKGLSVYPEFKEGDTVVVKYAVKKFDEGRILTLFSEKEKVGLLKKVEVKYATVQLINIIRGDTKDNVVVKIKAEELFLRNACVSEFCDGDKVILSNGWEATVIGVRKNDNHVMMQFEDVLDENFNPALGHADPKYLSRKH